MNDKKTNHTSINELNSLIKGENMAVDSIEKTIKHVYDDRIKENLYEVQQNHIQHAMQLTYRVQELGGTPAKGVGLSGKAAEVMTNIKDMKKHSASYFLNELCEGESKGISMAIELVKGDLDEESAELVSTILSEDKVNLNTLAGILHSVNSQVYRE